MVLPVLLPFPGRGRTQATARITGGAKSDPMDSCLGQGLRAFQHEHPLGLVVVGGGGIAGSLQDHRQLLRFYIPAAELSERVALCGQLFKIHRYAPLHSLISKSIAHLRQRRKREITADPATQLLAHATCTETILPQQPGAQPAPLHVVEFDEFQGVIIADDIAIPALLIDSEIVVAHVIQDPLPGDRVLGAHQEGGHHVVALVPGQQRLPGARYGPPPRWWEPG